MHVAITNPLMKTTMTQFKRDDHTLELLYGYLKTQYPAIHRWYKNGTNVSLPLEHPCRQLYFKHGRYLIQHGAFATHVTINLHAGKVPPMKLYQRRVDKCVEALQALEAQCHLLSERENLVGLLSRRD